MKYNPALDGIRALAIIIILAYHSGEEWHLGGHIGVDIFFVLSGFLITSLLTEEIKKNQQIHLKRFYISRAMRLYPNLIAMLICYLTAAPLLWPEANSIKESLLSLFYLTDYSIAFTGEPITLAHTWSLSIEEHFYLIWPIFLPKIIKSKNPSQVLLILYLTATAWRFFNEYTLGWTFTYFRFDTRLSGFLLGGLVATSKPSLNRSLGIIGLIGLPFLALQDSFNTNEGVTTNIVAAEILTAIVISGSLSSSPVYTILSSRPLTIIGKLSYGLYLWHFPAMFWLRQKYNWETTLILGFSFSLAVSAIIYRLIEEPIKEKRKSMRSPPINSTRKSL